jgi:hypothetical protein
MNDDLTTTLAALARLLDIANVGTVRAHSSRWDNGTLAEYEIETNTRRRDWTIVNSGTGFTESFAGGTYQLHDSTGALVERRTDTSFGLVPPAIRLCYPLDLPIWGRENDTWAIREATKIHHGFQIQVRHRHQEDMAGELLVDDETRLLTRWATFRGGEVIADYRLSAIVVPRGSSRTDGDDETVTAISFEPRDDAD